MYHHAKSVTYFGFLCFQSTFFVYARRNRPSNLALKTTVLEDTHLTLAVIPFKAGTNNSLFFSLLHTREKISQVSVPVQSIIP